MGAFSSSSFSPAAFSEDAFDIADVVSPDVPLTLLTRSRSATFIIPNFLIPLILITRSRSTTFLTPNFLLVDANYKYATRINAVLSGTRVNAKFSGTRVNAKSNITRVK